MHKLFRLVAVMMVLLSACRHATVQVVTSTLVPTGVTTGTLVATGALTPYLTVTPSPTFPAPTLPVEIPVTPAPTATPVIYTVKGNDTMLIIAYKYGISLDELKAANPTVDPNAMGEGLKLVIPVPQETPEIQPTATLVPVDASQPRCYRAGDGGAWCVASVANDLKSSLENISVWIGLYNDQGEDIASQTAYAPLNILRPGGSMPLVVYFPPPIPSEFQAQAKLTGALIVAANDTRYLDALVTVKSVKISTAALEARISGVVKLPEGSTSLTQLWVLGVAYDADGNIIGTRKWKSDGETTFDFSVYSLGRPIDHIKTLVEARP